MTHREAVPRWLKRDGIGVEIGAFTTPVPGIKPFYVDRFSEYAGKPCLADFWGDACHLPFRDDSLDYVVSSHVLEHVANPVQALLEWHRVLRPGGIIYAVVPDRRYTFDHARALTDPEHLWDDYVQQVNQRDLTHAEEFITKVDWSRYSPQTPAADVPHLQQQWLADQHRFVRDGGEINIHFHVFEPSNLGDFVRLASRRLGCDWSIRELRDQFPAECPNGILLVIRVRKHSMRAWLRSQRNRLQARRNRNAVLQTDAKPLTAANQMRRSH